MVGQRIAVALPQPDLGIIFEWRILLPLVGLAALSLVPVIYRQLRRKRET